MYKSYIHNKANEIVFYASYDDFTLLLNVLNVFVRDTARNGNLTFPLSIRFEIGRGSKRVRVTHQEYVSWQQFRDKIYLLNRRYSRDARSTVKAFFENAEYAEPVQIESL